MKGSFENSRQRALEEIRIQFKCFVKRMTGSEFQEARFISYRRERLETAIDYAVIFGLISQEEGEAFSSACELLVDEAYDASGYAI